MKMNLLTHEHLFKKTYHQKTTRAIKIEVGQFSYLIERYNYDQLK